MEEILALFAHTEIFIFVFMEILAKIDVSKRILDMVATWKDKLLFVALLGGFSIFGTLVGIPLNSGAIANIRDLAPTVAGLMGGPVIGVLVGLVGGIHRFFMGGITAVPCALSTVLAGLIGGVIYLWNRKKLIGIWHAVLVMVGVEVIHGLLTLAIARPLDEAWTVVEVAIPAMMIANGLGIAISIIVLDRIKPKEIE